MNVSWKPPSTLNGIITNYILYYGETPAGDESTITLNDMTYNHIFDACGGVTYKLKVWARTVKDGPDAGTTVTVNTYGKNKQTNNETNTKNVIVCA